MNGVSKRTFVAVVSLSGTLAGFWITACGLGTNGMAPVPEEASSDSSAAVDAVEDTTVPKQDVVEPVEATVDAPAEAPVVDAVDAGEAGVCTQSNCGGACCGNVCRPRSCEGCSAGVAFCPFSTTLISSNGYCVPDCSQCAADDAASPLPIACTTCGAGATTTNCATSATKCPPDLDSGACTCSTDASCPGEGQVCVHRDATAPACLTCGQPGTNSQPCTNGLTCGSDSGTCGP